MPSASSVENGAPAGRQVSLIAGLPGQWASKQSQSLLLLSPLAHSSCHPNNVDGDEKNRETALERNPSLSFGSGQRWRGRERTSLSTAKFGRPTMATRLPLPSHSSASAYVRWTKQFHVFIFHLVRPSLALLARRLRQSQSLSRSIMAAARSVLIGVWWRY